MPQAALFSIKLGQIKSGQATSRAFARFVRIFRLCFTRVYEKFDYVFCN